MHVVDVNMEDTDDSTRLLVKEQRVFYCGDCREIFGDSLSTVRTNKDLESVSLQCQWNNTFLPNPASFYF